MNGEQLLALCRQALADAGEAEAEVYARVADRGCARFAMGALGQHMQLTEPHAVVRVAHGRRVAEAATSRLDRAALVAAVRDAARAAEHVPEVEGFPGFAGADDGPIDAPLRYADATARATPEERVERLAPVLESIRGRDS